MESASQLSFDYFAKATGRFRISLTSDCTNKCWFCHNEGAVPPIQATPETRRGGSTLSEEGYINFVQALLALGVRRIQFTGGEPLLSPMLLPVLAAVPQHDTSQFKITIATNGILLENKLDALSTVPVDKLKVSLHAFTDDSFFRISRVRGIERVKRAIAAARQVFRQVEINVLLMPENRDEIYDIIEFARETKVPVEVLELVWTEWNAPVYGNKRMTTSDLAEGLIRRGGRSSIERRHVGADLQVIEYGDTKVKLMDSTLKRLRVKPCDDCPVLDRCREGFLAMRLNPDGMLRPCLMRDDTMVDLKPYIKDQGALRQLIPRWVDAFMRADLTASSDSRRTTE